VILGTSAESLIVVLGSPNDERGNLSSIARERLGLAAKEYFGRPSHGILLTGGFGAHFNRSALPHAEHARSFLYSMDVPEAAFTEFALSGNTVEDALLARPIVQRLGAEELVVVTSDYHIARARYIFDRVFPRLEIRYAGATHEAAPADLRRLADHEERALARLQEAEGSSKQAEKDLRGRLP